MLEFGLLAAGCVFAYYGLCALVNRIDRRGRR